VTSIASGQAVGAHGTPLPPAAHDAEAIGASVVIIADGKTRQLRIACDGPSILDAGLAAGANLPYACKAAVCCTCRARVLEGEVRMDHNYTLEPQEIAKGFVLTCQSHPVTDRVVISFDER
jgi:ring-1,2-phenylacetyl-CoA epoxidase subunit PaaE